MRTDSSSHFIAYVAFSDLHDAHIVRVQQDDDRVVVFIHNEYEGGRQFALEFTGVTRMDADSPDGMMLYALCEFTAAHPLRHFIFANWDDEDERRLEIFAEDLRVLE